MKFLNDVFYLWTRNYQLDFGDDLLPGTGHICKIRSKIIVMVTLMLMLLTLMLYTLMLCTLMLFAGVSTVSMAMV